MYDDTRMCMGDVPSPHEYGPAHVGAWEVVVFDSAFTHVNHHAALPRRTTSDDDALLGYWACEARRTTPPAAEDLSPLGLTLGEWLKATVSPDRRGA